MAAPRHGKIPRRVRFTFASRIDALALDVVEDLVEARYSKDKREILKRANLRLEKIRVLLRLCHEQQFLPRRLRVRHPWCGRNRSDAGRVDETAGGEMTTTDMAEKICSEARAASRHETTGFPVRPDNLVPQPVAGSAQGVAGQEG